MAWQWKPRIKLLWTGIKITWACKFTPTSLISIVKQSFWLFLQGGGIKSLQEEGGAAWEWGQKTEDKSGGVESWFVKSGGWGMSERQNGGFYFFQFIVIACTGTYR